jgi:hypothetical protein
VLGEPLSDELFQHLKTMPFWRHMDFRADISKLNPRDVAFVIEDCRALALRLAGAPADVVAA